ncbi:MAG: YihY/virulence factor BrkB family protein [Alphaproteobacteria bacterium]|nr:YihY/virulence factor BrkB family protein [Alphaproteobacteria bacterium]
MALVSVARYFDLAVNTAKRFLMHEGMTRAGAISFSSLFALFPFLLFLTALAAMVGETAAVCDFVNYAMKILPPDVAGTLQPAIEQVLGASEGGVLTFSMLMTLWAATSGVEALRDALNVAYDVEQQRHFLMRRLQGTLIVLMSSVVILFVMTSFVFLPLLWEPLAQWLHIAEATFWIVNGVQIGLSILLVWAGIALLYRWLPNVPQNFRDVIPGAILSGVLWFAILAVFSWYLRSFGRFTVIYGSLGGIVVTLMFFYLSATSLIIGAEFNAARRLQRVSRETAEAAARNTLLPKP